MNNTYRHIAQRTPHNQRGATLIVSLVLLMLLTLMGVAAIEGISLQSNMARNSQFQIQAYQVALSEINAQLDGVEEDIAVLQTAITDGEAPITGDAIAMSPDHMTQTVQFDYVGEGLPPPGYSVDTYVGQLFELDSVAQIDNTGIGSDQTQGLNYAGPK